jgi:phosphoglycolate phosphatase
MITSSYLCAHYLKEKKFAETVYLFGGKGLKEELDNVGIENVGEGPDAMPEEWDLETAENVMNTMVNNIGCVIVGFHYDLSYMKLLKAATYLQNPEVLFLGTNSDPMAAVHFESRTCIMPATGSLIAATQTASGRSPIILGKPDKFMFDAVKRVFPKIKPDRTLMIGDRADTDVVFGKNAGLITLMVGTGTNNKTDIQDWEMSNDDTHKKLIPNYYSESLFRIFEWNDSGVTKENDDREVAQ